MIENGVLKPDGAIQLRGGVSSVLTAENPMPLRREIMLEVDTGRCKIGDGIHRWNELNYAMNNTSSSTSQGDSSAAILYDNKIYFLDVVAKNGELISISPEINEVADMTFTVNTEISPIQFTGTNVEVNF